MEFQTSLTMYLLDKYIDLFNNKYKQKWLGAKEETTV